MLDQETLDDLVSLAKRVDNQVSKRALRTIATREIADAFNDCGIMPVERWSRIKSDQPHPLDSVVVDEMATRRRDRS